MSHWNIVIGLEVHAQLSTHTKLFCSCPVSFGEEPNSSVCPVCLGMPGVLPVPNSKALESAVKLGLATNCNINNRAMWTRKNYFYPDLPKGYQITQQGDSPQYDHPICRDGYLDIKLGDQEKKIRIMRIHMEEDAGKLIHDQTPSDSLFDANRCGTPLLEIVSHPDIGSAAEAVAYLEKLKQILEYLDISDANMEKGNLRCDVNISLRASVHDPLGTRVEIKNMNSFSQLERAIEAEVALQELTLNSGGKIEQVTKRWDPNQGKTFVMRSKEMAHDYRYFPEPDMLPLTQVTTEYINNLNAQLPELPQARLSRFKQEYHLGEYEAGVLTAQKWIADYFDEVCKNTTNAKQACNWVMGEILRLAKESPDGASVSISPRYLAQLVEMLVQGEITGRIAKQVFALMEGTNEDPQSLVESRGWKTQKDTGALEKIIEDIVQANPVQVAQYREGKNKVLGFFVGQIMKATQGKADPGQVNQILLEKLSTVSV